MGNLRTTLKRGKTVRGRRWIVKRNEDDGIKEVKMIFKPEEYTTYKNSKTMYGDKELLKILENEKEKNNS
tara:strand:- start:2 stop:211 length:210 start_codon:yes stop_codon:yes gene_type:complete